MRTDYYVYCWTNTVNGKQYVGKGRRNRAKLHTYPCSKSRLSSAMRKHGLDMFRLEFLAEGLSEIEAFALECEHIASRKTLVPDGYNLSTGGEGVSGYVVSESTKEKLRATRIGVPRAPETVEKMRKSLTGRKFNMSEEERIARSVRGRAFRHTTESRNKIKETKARQSNAPDPEYVRFLLSLGATGKDIALWFEVGASTISRIRRRAERFAL